VEPGQSGRVTAMVCVKVDRRLWPSMSCSWVVRVSVTGVSHDAGMVRLDDRGGPSDGSRVMVVEPWVSDVDGDTDTLGCGVAGAGAQYEKKPDNLASRFARSKLANSWETWSLMHV